MLLADVRADARYTSRALVRTPGFTAAAAATIALGIGGATAIFSVTYAVSIRPLPYAQSDRLIRIYEANLTAGQIEHDVSVGSFHAWRERAATVESLALFSKLRTRFLSAAERQHVATMSVSPAFFHVLGVAPMLGPGFKPESRYAGESAKETVLSHAAWQRLFGGRPDIIGSQLELAGVRDKDSYRVVGVMPPSFSFERVDAWHPEIVDVPVPPVVRGWRYDRVIARLRPPSTIDHARAELELIAAQLAREFPRSNSGWTVTVESLRDSVIGAFGRATWLLLAAVAVVLFVACLNVGGLLIVRAMVRARETTVREALGAGAWRIWRLRLAEAAVLATLGAGLGLTLAWTTVSTLKVSAPPGIPRLEEIAIDAPSLVVAAASTVLAVITFTVAPLARKRDQRLNGSSASQAISTTRRSVAIAHTALIFAQCAGTVTLVGLGVMLTRSFFRLTATDLGWDSSGVLSVTVSPPMPRELRRPWFRYVDWSDRLITSLESVPGVERAAVTTQVPLSLDSYQATLARASNSSTDGSRWSAVQHNVTDGYFAAMGIRLVSGRTFGAMDRFSEAQMTAGRKSERGVAVVTEATARMLWGASATLGERISLPDADNVTWREVVGVVEDIQFHAIGEKPALHVFVPWSQQSTARPRLIVKGTATATALAPIVLNVVRAVEPGTQVEPTVPLEALVSRATAQQRFTSRVMAGFGVLALTLAAVGIYGMVSTSVGARTREISIRLALGAPPACIRSSIVRLAFAPVMAGGVVGVVLAAVVARTFRALFFEYEPLDVPSLALGSIVLLLVALAAASGPAYRATRIDPAHALRVD